VYHRVNVDSSINVISMTRPHSWIGAAEAAALLQVSRPTLYAYVSRGLIRSQDTPGPSRERRYARDDVERLRQRAEERRHPDKAAAQAMHWGLPILESSLTYIDGRALYFRGEDARALAESRTIADVASLLWTGRYGTAFPAASVETTRMARAAGPLPFVPRAQIALASVRDPLAFDLRPERVALTGWRILGLLTATATTMQAEPPRRRREPPAPLAIEQRLARAWRLRAEAADLVRRALILCADHELNVSSFTARCVASAGSHPYAVTIAALAALEGSRHGGATARVDAMLDALRRARVKTSALADRLRRGEPVDGVGHPLYRDGDPRAIALIEALRAGWPRSAELAFMLDVARAAESVTGERPNLDFALVGVERVLRLPPGSALTLFAIGRAIGWIGHAIEQYAIAQLIRPRAKYVGPMPAAR
jgi:citrate synthase